MATVAVRRRQALDTETPIDSSAEPPGTSPGSPSSPSSPSTPTTPSSPMPGLPGAPPTYTNRSAEINAQNPNADPSRPYVQAGDTGGYLEGIGVTRGAGTSLTQGAYDRYYNEALAAGIPKDWLDDFLRRNPNDPHRAIEGYRSEQAGSGRDQQTGAGGTGLSTASSLASRLASSGVPQQSAQFTDPIAKAIEAAALARSQRLENPPADSGVAMLETMLRNAAQQFQSGGYTPAEQEIFQTRAIEPIEQLRSARKQQVIQSLSARGITPDSGVGRSMLADVDRQFDALRGQTQRELAATEAQERTNRILQALGLAGQLSASEEGRLDRGFQYRTVPLNLADRSFTQAMQLYSAAGNPLSLVNPLLSLSQQQQNQSNAWASGLADIIYALANLGA